MKKGFKCRKDGMSNSDPSTLKGLYIYDCMEDLKSACCQNNSEFNAKIRRYFAKFSRWLPNFQISRRSKSGAFFGVKKYRFAKCSFSVVYERR